jgi:hypothetical protein
MKDAQVASSSAVLDDGSSLQKAAIVAANRDAGEAPAAGMGVGCTAAAALLA